MLGDTRSTEASYVAILILLESFLQYKTLLKVLLNLKESQSLFYWNPFCNLNINDESSLWAACRNPYFIGILSAMEKGELELELAECRNPYFIGILSAIEKIANDLSKYLSRNPYFIGILSAIKETKSI